MEKALVCVIANTNIKQNYRVSLLAKVFCWNYEQSSQTNQCTWCSHLKYEAIFSKKKLFMGGQTFLDKTFMGRLF